MSAVLAATTGVATLGLSSPAMADGTPECNGGAGLDSTECGAGSNTGTGDLAIAVGHNAQATGDGSTAVGDTAEATAFGTVAMGAFGEATAAFATTLGYNATASAIRTTAVGAESDASADDATSLGFNANAVAVGSVALGAGSFADRANTVSVGSVGSERQIANVAAGTEDTDAVNVAQLNAVRAQLQGQLSNVFDDIERLNEGVALSLAMESPAIPDGADFALSGGIGYFNESTAGAAAFTARIAPRASLSAGVGIGFETNEVGARAGFQVAW